MPHSIWRLVAERSGARMYARCSSGLPTLIGAIAHPAGRLRPRDLEAAEGARAYGRFGEHRHALSSRESAVDRVAATLAKSLADRLRTARFDHQCDNFVLVAGSRMPGRLRAAPDDDPAAIVSGSTYTLSPNSRSTRAPRPCVNTLRRAPEPARPTVGRTPADPAALVSALASRCAAWGVSCAPQATHISEVLLAGAQAYKCKKPRDLEFLDFRTPTLRGRRLRARGRAAPTFSAVVLPQHRAGDAGPEPGGDGPLLDHPVWIGASATPRISIGSSMRAA
jgi:hypothetical protein